MSAVDAKRPPLLCRILGHAWEPVAAKFYCVYLCERCLHEGYSDGSIRERVSLRLWIWRNRLSEQTHRWRAWLTCSDCGKHFGRHDESADHLPF